MGFERQAAIDPTARLCQLTTPCRYDTLLCGLMAVVESGISPYQPGRAGQWFQWLCLASVVAIFALVVLGGVVRVTESGLGCPDWPLCYGKVIPPLRADAIIEYSHRLVASVLVGPLVFATCCVAWVVHWKRGPSARRGAGKTMKGPLLSRRSKGLVWGATFAVALVLVQAILGGITVLTELHGSLVAAHLAMAEALLACMIILFVGSRRAGTPSTGGTGHYLPIVAAAGLGVYVLIMSGSFVTVSGSTAACTQWPTCNGNLVPATAPQFIHMLHRLAAVLIGVLLLYALHLGFRQEQGPKELRYLSIIAAVVFAAQVLAGAFTVWFRFPVELRALHLALATLLWAAVVALTAVAFAGTRLKDQEPAHA